MAAVTGFFSTLPEMLHVCINRDASICPFLHKHRDRLYFVLCTCLFYMMYLGDFFQLGVWRVSWFFFVTAACRISFRWPPTWLKPFTTISEHASYSENGFWREVRWWPGTSGREQGYQWAMQVHRRGEDPEVTLDIPELERLSKDSTVGPDKGYPDWLAFLYLVKTPMKIGVKEELFGN